MYDAIIFTEVSNWPIPMKTIGAYKIAQSMRQRGYKVKVINNFLEIWNTDREELIFWMKDILKSDAKFIGISGTFASGPRHIKKEYNFRKENFDMVFLDEIQFLDTSETLKNIELILGEGIDVVCAGLDQDSRGKPWETSAMILGLSDKILKIYGFCNVCGMEATKTYRKEEGGGRTQVGAANIYEPRCLKHWTAR